MESNAYTKDKKHTKVTDLITGSKEEKAVIMTGDVYKEQKLKASVKMARSLRHNSMYTRRERPWNKRTLREAEKALEEMGYGNVIAGLDERLKEPQ